jgi:iron complex outermembrane receptor protein
VNARYELNDIGALNSGTTDHGNRCRSPTSTSSWTVSWAWRWATPTWSRPIRPSASTAGAIPTDATTLVDRRHQAVRQSSELKRDGYIGVLEFKPNDRFSSSLDAFYSKFKNSQILRGIELPLVWGGSAGD